jgi:uncharacterized protein (TIGR00369 family)
MAQPTESAAGFSELIGIEYLSLDLGDVRARIEVGPQHLQPTGVVHGGVYASLAESVCSAASYGAVDEKGMIPMGQANSTTFLRPITEGHVNATATLRQRGRTTWVWDCELSDDEGRVCALVRMTVAIRPRRPG